MKPHLSVLDLLSKALRRAVDPLFLDVDQMQRGRRLQDLRGKLTGPDTASAQTARLGMNSSMATRLRRTRQFWT
jgi:hypothetical protein